jgi:hypothetical protein
MPWEGMREWEEANPAAVRRWPGANFTAGWGRAWEGGRAPKLGISAKPNPGSLLMHSTVRRGELYGGWRRAFCEFV